MSNSIIIGGKNGISVGVVADSKSRIDGSRITTLQLRYPRFIHAEFMTHRVFSRNASSSRAIPVKKMLRQVWSDPATPLHWGKNQPGMQADTQLTGFKKFVVRSLWKNAGRVVCAFAWGMTKIGLHKQVANRILEPWQFIHVVVTATDWDNFFELRAHPDAQPEIHELAITMMEAMNDSAPKILNVGEWHLPYVRDEESIYNLSYLLKMSAARCARVSYLTHDGKNPDIEKDLELYDRLIVSKPMHASPIEHQATPMDVEDLRETKYSGNFSSWVQYRKIVERNATQTNEEHSEVA